jgi:hypothetical protein
VMPKEMGTEMCGGRSDITSMTPSIAFSYCQGGPRLDFAQSCHDPREEESWSEIGGYQLQYKLQA